MAVMSGVHVVIVPAWWPSPEQPVAGVFFEDYARAFAAAGAKVGVVYPDLVSLRHWGRGTKIPWLPRVFEESLGGIPVVRIRGLHTALGRPGLQMRRFRSWLKRGLAVYRARHGEPDLLHAMCAIPAGWACTHLDDPLADRVVLTEHTGPFSLVMTPKAGESFVRAGMAGAATVVAVSEQARDEMREAGIAREIEVRGNCVADEFLRGCKKRVEPLWHRRLGGEDTGETPVPHKKDPVIHPPKAGIAGARSPGIRRALFVGRLEPEKGIPELLEVAMELAASLNVDWHFAGDGSMSSEIKARFCSAGVEQRCKLHGLCDRSGVVRLMSTSDFLIHPSHAESFGMVVAEALCLGLPVVTTRGTACAEFVCEENGILVEMRNVESLKVGIGTLIERLPTFDRSTIAERARSKFSAETLAQWYARLFDSVMRRNGEWRIEKRSAKGE